MPFRRSSSRNRRLARFLQRLLSSLVGTNQHSQGELSLDAQFARATKSSLTLEAAMAIGSMPKSPDTMYDFIAPHPQHEAFLFTLPTECIPWPGPGHGEQSLHPRNAARPRRKYRKLVGKPRTAVAQHRLGTRSKISTGSSDHAMTELAAELDGLAITGQSTGRDPPLNLLTLPGEIRNQIYAHLAVAHEPLDAQFRRLHSKVGARVVKVIRRFPLEPAVASANRQLRFEVLAMFYAKNRFIFKRNKSAALVDLNMLDPAMLQKWAPAPGFAAAIKRVELRFQPWRPGFETSCVLERSGGSLVKGCAYVEISCTCLVCAKLANLLRLHGPWTMEDCDNIITGVVDLMKTDLSCFLAFDRASRRVGA